MACKNMPKKIGRIWGVRKMIMKMEQKETKTPVYEKCYKCKFCGMVFMSKHNIKKHVYVDHQDDMFELSIYEKRRK